MILASLHSETWINVLQHEGLNVVKALNFSKKLTLEPDKISENDIKALKITGYNDHEVSYIVQIVSSFAYWCIMINALGTQIGESIGFAKTLKL